GGDEPRPGPALRPGGLRFAELRRHAARAAPDPGDPARRLVLLLGPWPRRPAAGGALPYAWLIEVLPAVRHHERPLHPRATADRRHRQRPPRGALHEGHGTVPDVRLLRPCGADSQGLRRR